MSDVVVLDDPAAALAERIAAAAGDGAQIVLTGGSSPRDAYERAAKLGADWSRATLWFGDERCVAPEDERSNYAMAKAALLDPAGIAEPQVRRMRGELGADAGAEDYEHVLHEGFDDEPRFDLLLLGLGPDAHVASLFPGQHTLDEPERWVVGVHEAGFEPYVPRVSLTLPAINSAREVVFLVTGDGKAEAVARAFGGTRDRQAPASLVAPRDGTLTVLLDPPAARLLEPERA
jgi:6-phosphogluconolactonase